MLLDSKGGRYYDLDEVGARIWQLADGTRSVATIASLLAEEYDAPPATIQSDALELVAELVKDGLVRDAEAS